MHQQCQRVQRRSGASAGDLDKHGSALHRHTDEQPCLVVMLLLAHFTVRDGSVVTTRSMLRTS